MIAGVGKTYRMLQEAHELLKVRIDVKIGFIETHLREETQALVRGIPQIHRKKVFYKGRELEEMDLDTILLERPEIVIVDELAHTNIPGCKNEKRWQDVLDLIRAGIHVITAFNIQHLESLADKVKQIAGIDVSERIPDSFLNYADEVVNIDLPSQDLINRLKAGKIYKGERIQRALDNFFQPEKILQLRDLALRQVVSYVEKKIETEMPTQPRMQIERFMACISTYDEGAKKIIRKTALLANHYQADWYALYVQTKRENPNTINTATQRKLLANFKRVTELGGRVIKIESENIPEAIFQTALDKKINNLVIGKPTMSIWRSLTGRNYFDKLMKKVNNRSIDVIIVS